MSRSLLVVLAAWVVTFNISAALAPPVVLTYRAPPDCPPEELVVSRVSALVQHQPSIPVVAKVTITRQGAAYLLELDVEGGRQRIVGESCDSLVQTLTVILALAVDPRPQPQPPDEHQRPDSAAKSDNVSTTETKRTPSAVAAPQASTAVSRLTRATPPSVDAVRKASPSASQAVTAASKPHEPIGATDLDTSTGSHIHQTSSKIRLHPSMLLWTEYGMLPHLALGPNLGLWVDRDDWSLAASAEWLLPQWAQIPDVGQPRGGYVSFLGGRLGPCFVVLQPGLIRTCVGGEAGDMMGKGSGVSRTQLGHGVWLAVTAEVALRLRIRAEISADVRLGLALPVKRPAFGIDGYAWRFEPHPWSLRLASGFSWF